MDRSVANPRIGLLLLLVFVSVSVSASAKDVGIENGNSGSGKSLRSQILRSRKVVAAGGEFGPATAEAGIGLFDAFFASLSMLLVSEIGDETFIIAALMAMRHPKSIVLSGALSALVAMTVLSTGLGRIVPNLISRKHTNSVATEAVHFDSELPHYKTKDGVYRDPVENGRIVSPTLMWVEALELILDRLQSKLDFGKVVAVSGSGQQHGSVYWKKTGLATLASLDPAKPLFSQLGDAFSTKESPIWMDSSTTAQCREIEKALGGALELSKLTGSRAYERFTGPQIRKLYETHQDVYTNTERISLVSSFMASLLIGGHASIDETDAAGMNLMDIKQRVWSKIALEATAPGLEEKLGKLAPPHAVAGVVSPYFVKRFNFKKDCLVIHWSGDNPNSLAGLTLNTPGDLAISLGTSDTVLGITSDPQPSLEGHVFPNPVDPKCYMVMLCYKNGSLTRENVRNQCAEGSWDVFNKFLEKTAPLNGGKLGFYYKEHEILPPLPVGFHRFVIDNFNSNSLGELKEHEVEEFDHPSEVRAIIEGQFLSMRGHAERFGMPTPPKRIIATGGASSNESILSSIASIFGCPVYTVQRPDSASLGAALRAAHGWLCNKNGRFVPISSMYEGKLEKTALSAKLAKPAGDKELLSKYALLAQKRMEIEKSLLEKFQRT